MEIPEELTCLFSVEIESGYVDPTGAHQVALISPVENNPESPEADTEPEPAPDQLPVVEGETRPEGWSAGRPNLADDLRGL